MFKTKGGEAMKKKIMSIIMLFAITFCFVNGCKDNENTEQAVLVADGKEVIATINGVNYTANDIYDILLSKSTNVQYIYEKMEDLLIKTIVPITETMRNRITNEVEKWKNDIKEDATISGTSYKDALASALESEGVSSEEELIEKKLFALQEEIITDQYWRDAKEGYLTSYFANTYVYHISQIVVSVGTNGNYDYFSARPDASAMEKIYNIIDQLSSGTPFYRVAQEYSDDSSADNGGDLGMITLNSSSISSEVKYALASYSKYVEGAEIETPQYLDTVYGNGIEAIPQEYVNKLMEKNSNDEYLYEDDTTKYINSLPSSFDNYRVYGRNVIFNSLFNSRTFRVIQSTSSTNTETVEYVRMPKVDAAEFYDKATNSVLVNDEGHPILVVRSDTGIHFISIKKSAFEGTQELLKYYSTDIIDDDYKTYVEKSINSEMQNERIEKLESLAKEYAILSTSDNSSFAGNNDFIRYDMFLSYLGKTVKNVTFDITNEKIKTLIVNYINNKKALAQNKIANYFSEKYEAYANIAKHSDNPLILKEIPILKCLDNKACTYSYKKGFEVYGGEA